MKREPVVSSVVASAGYDFRTRTLEVEFVSGALYHYCDVPARVYREFMDAPSKGEFLNSAIVHDYECERVR